MGLVIGFFVLLLNNFRVFSFYAYGGTQNISFYLLIKLVLDFLFLFAYIYSESYSVKIDDINEKSFNITI